MTLILVGGFLGAGKTTLLRDAAHRLAESGHTVGLITNDQAPDLVDTAVLSGTPAQVREVSGSCFCCNFNGFEAAIRSLVDAGSDVIIAEPVGSCTDLSATILQPLKQLYSGYDLAPLTVLLDPARAADLLDAEAPLLHPDAAYIMRLQLAEADRILLTKADTLAPEERASITDALRHEFPNIPVDTISCVSGEGCEEWLAEIIEAAPAGERIVEVDYDRYANGEAVLGWLNTKVELRWIGGLEPRWADFTHALLDGMQRSFQQTENEVGHAKLLLASNDGQIAANLTGLHHPIRTLAEGPLTRLTATLTLNARVQTTPEDLEDTFRKALANAAHGHVACTINALHCLQPGRPVPTHRYTAVVA